MALLLAIETSGDLCSVALGDQCIAELAVNRARGHNEFLLPAIDRLLREGGYRLSQLDGIAVGIGPGSFTGLRIGIGVVQGLALGAGLGVLPVSSLAALAQAGVREAVLGEGDLALPVIDARMGQVYWGGYEIVAGLAVRRAEDRLDLPSGMGAALAAFGPRDWVGLGDGWALVPPPAVASARCRQALAARAADVLRLAQVQFRRDALLPPELLEPHYLRGSEHWRKWPGATISAQPE